MLVAQDFVNYIEAQLNSIGASDSPAYSFRLFAESGETKEGKHINGVCRTFDTKFKPLLPPYTDGTYVFVIELIVSTPNGSNYHYNNVSRIVSSLVAGMQRKTIALDGGECVITLTSGVPKNYEVSYGYAGTVPLTFTATVNYTVNAVTSADKHWLLDGNEIGFLSESVSVERDGMVRSIFSDEYKKILLTGQTKYYTFVVPYDGTLYSALQTEILNSAWETHTLSYYDGVAFSPSNPFTQQVVIFRTGTSRSESPDAAAFEITFSDKYNASGQMLQYELALIDFPFDMQGEDTRFFSSQTEQTQYFVAKAAASTAPFVAIDAPNLDNLMITRQVYQGSRSGAGAQFDYASKNYAIIRVTSSSSTHNFYYFIENCAIGTNGQVIVDLKMDTVQTYFFDPSVTFSDCLIERANLDRFDPDSANTVAFNSDPSSKIFNSEDGLNFPKRLVSRTKLNLRFTGRAAIDTWLNENIAYWVYIFIDPTATYTIGKLDGSANTVSGANFPVNTYPIGFNGATNVIAYPIYKNASNAGGNPPTSNVININNVSAIEGWGSLSLVPHQSAMTYFQSANNNTSYFYNKKISIIPPFSSLPSNAFIDSNNNLSISATSPGTDGNKPNCSVSSFTGSDGSYNRVVRGEYGGGGFDVALFVSCVQSDREIETFPYLLTQNNAIDRSSLIAQQPPNPAYNPKLNGQNFKELKITTASGDDFTYDIQKIAGTSAIFLYSEPILPEITRYYFRLQAPEGLYTEGSDENYMGLVGTSDSAILFTNDNYEAFLANNKNFFMQSNLKIGVGAISNLIGAAKRTASGNLGGAAASVIGTAANTALDLIDRSMTIDNLKSSPDQMKNANGSVIFNLFVMDVGLYVEEYSALDGDLKSANDFMDLYGFTFNTVANVKDYANIRKYHNYVKAQLQSISGNLSNIARKDLRQRFADGVRFWNQDNVSYEYENYELWLED